MDHSGRDIIDTKIFEYYVIDFRLLNIHEAVSLVLAAKNKWIGVIADITLEGLLVEG